MATVKEMRVRIGSVKSTQKITKALQMVAAAKLRRAQQATEAARPYAQRMSAIISNLAAGVSGPSAPLLLAGTGSDKRHLVIVATADRGLAGAFNGSIVRAARQKIAERLSGYLGIPVDYLLKSDLRVSGGQFSQQLQMPGGLTTGRIDTRYSGPSLDILSKEAQ